MSLAVEEPLMYNLRLNQNYAQFGFSMFLESYVRTNPLITRWPLDRDQFRTGGDSNIGQDYQPKNYYVFSEDASSARRWHEN